MAENLKKEVLNRFIENVSFDGWSQKNLENSVKSLGLQPNYLLLLLPDGLNGLTSYFVKENNADFTSSIDIEAISKLKFTDRIKFLTLARILHYHKVLGGPEGFKNFISYCSTHNILSSISNITAAADEIWYNAGDRSTDFSYYTKRLSLSLIYSSAALYSINDNSLGLEETKNFIDARVAEILKFNKLKLKIKSLVTNPFGFSLFGNLKFNK